MAAAANPAQRTAASGLVPYFRRYDLPWSPSEEMERRFRVILRNLVIAFAIIAVIIPFLPRRERVVNTESLPERVVQLVLEPPPPPPPPPPPETGEAAREGAGHSQARDAAGGRSRQGREERTSRQHGRSGGATRHQSGQTGQEPAEDHRSRRRDRGDPFSHHLQGGRHQRRHQRAHQLGIGRRRGSLNGIHTAQVKDPTLATGSQGSHARGRQRQGLAQRRRDRARIHPKQGCDRCDVCAGAPR